MKKNDNDNTYRSFLGLDTPTQDSRNRTHDSLNETDVRLNEMSLSIHTILISLQQSMTTRLLEKTFVELYDYIYDYSRFLYSDISTMIYEINKVQNADEKSDSIMYNIYRLLRYSDTLNETDFKKALEQHGAKHEYSEQVFHQTKASVSKLYDHVNLANNQYSIFQVTEEQFKQRVKHELEGYKNDVLKEIYSQLITIVSIFTALAFIVFGSIGSLDTMFHDIRTTPVLKLILCSCIWSIGLLNLIFVFLFCIGKMTNLTFKTDRRPTATFWQRYPVVVWTNYLLLGILLIAGWLYFFYQDTVFFQAIRIDENQSALLCCAISLAVIALLFIFGACKLAKKTKPTTGDEDNHF